MNETVAMRPAEVARRLGVSTATLRRWSRRFENFLDLADGAQGEGSHRRYSAVDLQVLTRIKLFLEQGWNYDQVAQELAQHAATAQEGESSAIFIDEEAAPVSRSASISEVAAAGQVPPARDLSQAVAPESGSLAEALPPAAQFLRDTLDTFAETQQLILNSQRASRDMLGVMIQDNLNLKDENTSLRDRMLNLERELAELRRRSADYRERMETRVRILEDAVATLMAKQQPRSASPSQSTQQQPPEQRGFWSRLIGG